MGIMGKHENGSLFFLTLFWTIIALQCCVSFCCIKWISYTYAYVPISPPSCLSLPPSLFHPSRWSQAQRWSPCAMQLLPTTIYFTFGSVYMSMLLSHFVPAYPPPSPCPQVHFLCLHLYSCPAPRFIRTFFFSLDSIYMCKHTVFVFFFLTYFTLYDRLYVHPPHYK